MTKEDSFNQNEGNSTPKTIFISHKEQDKDIVAPIVEELKYIGDSSSLEIFVSHAIPYGQDWSRKIHEALKQSDMLILLYTDPSSDWDWCLYETGFFKGADLQEKQVVCLHAEDQVPPHPILGFKSVKTELDEVAKLVKEIAKGVNENIHNDFKKCRKIAGTIIESFGPPPKKIWYNDYIVIHLDETQVKELFETRSIPSEAILCESKDTTMDKLFNLQYPRPQGGHWKWRHLSDKLSGVENEAFKPALAKRILAAITGEGYEGNLPQIVSHKDVTYLPVLERRHFKGGALMESPQKFYSKWEKLTVVFIGMPDMPADSADGTLKIAYKLQYMARQSRWEVYRPFRDQLKKLANNPLDQNELKKYVEEFQFALATIRSRASRYGILSNTEPLYFIQDPRDYNKAKGFIQEWENLTINTLSHLNNGEIESAVEELNIILRNNKEYLRILSSHIANHIESEVAD